MMIKSLNSATMEVPTNENHKKSSSSKYSQIINNCETIMTRSKYRTIQEKIGCPMGTLLESLPSVSEPTAGSSGGSGRVCLKSEDKREWWRRWTGCRRPPGVALKRKRKWSARRLKKRLLECARMRRLSRAYSQLIPIKIPDPTPIFSFETLPSTSADPFNSLRPLTCNSPEDPVSEVSPSGMLTLQNTSMSSPVELMPKQHLIMDNFSTNQEEIFRESQPTTHQKICVPEITEQKSKEMLFMNIKCCDTGRIESSMETLVDVLNTNLEDSTSPTTLENILECEVGVSRPLEHPEEPVKEIIIDDTSNPICFSMVTIQDITSIPELVLQQSNWVSEITPEISVMKSEENDLINISVNLGDEVAMVESGRKSLVNDLETTSKDTTPSRISENILSKDDNDANNFASSMKVTDSSFNVPMHTWQQRNCDLETSINKSENTQPINTTIYQSDETMINSSKEKYFVNEHKTTLKDINSGSNLDYKMENPHSIEDNMIMNVHSDDMAEVFIANLKDTCSTMMLENNLDSKLNDSWQSERENVSVSEFDTLVRSMTNDIQRVPDPTWQHRTCNPENSCTDIQNTQLISIDLQCDDEKDMVPSEQPEFDVLSTAEDTTSVMTSRNNFEWEIQVSGPLEHIMNTNTHIHNTENIEQPKENYILDVNITTVEENASSITSGYELECEGDVSVFSEHQQEPVDVDSVDDERITTDWSMENTRGSVVSDVAEDMDVDSEGAENDPAMAVPDEWCDTCRKNLAPTPDIVSLSRRCRVPKWIGSLLGFMGLVNLPDDQRERDRLLEEDGMQSADGDASASQRRIFF